jgi:uncharacterized protein YecT (DUF1311 family)
MRPLCITLIGASLLVAGCSSPANSKSGTKRSTSSTTTPVISYNRSCEKKALTQVALDECAARELAELQQQLTPALRKEGAAYGSASVSEAQSEWVTFRHSECSLEANAYQGGSIQPLIYGECAIALTVQRLQEVRSALADRPGAGP